MQLRTESSKIYMDAMQKGYLLAKRFITYVIMLAVIFLIVYYMALPTINLIRGQNYAGEWPHVYRMEYDFFYDR